MPADAGTAFVTLLPRVSPGFGAAANAQIGGPLSGIAGKAGAVGTALGAGLITATAVGGAAIVGFSEKLNDGTDSIRRATGATGANLEALGQNFRNIVGSVAGAEVDDFATAIGDLNTRTGQTGPALEELATQAVRLSKVTGEDLGALIASTTRTFGDWSIATEDQAGALDDLFKVSQATGITVDKLSSQLVQFGAPLRQLGFSIDESAALLGKFEKEGVNAELVMGSMRIALGKMAREGEPAVETFKRVTGEIESAGSASEANALALELFGARAGPDMAAAIREGRFEVDELMASLENSPETLKAAADESVGFSERFSATMQRLGVALEPIGAAVIEFAEGKILPAIERVVAGIINLAAVFEEEGFAGVWERIGDRAAELWPRIRAWLIDTADKVRAYIADQAPVWGAALLDLAKTAAEWLLDAIPPFLSALGGWIGAGLEWLIGTGLPRLWHWLQTEAAPALWGWVEEAGPPFLKALGRLLIRFAGWLIGDALPFLASHAGEWIGALLGWLWSDALPALITGLGALLSAAGEWITGTALPYLADKAPEWIGALLGWLGDAIPQALGKLLELLVAVGDWIITTAVPFLIDKALALTGALLSFIGTSIINAPGQLLELFVGIGSWLIGTAIPLLVEKSAQLSAAVLTWLAEATASAPGKLLELFGAITSWLTTDAPGLIADAAGTAFEGILDALKAVLRKVIEAWNALDLDFKVPDVFGIPHRGETFDLVPDFPVPAVLMAKGGTALEDLTAVVGEAGPEIVQLPRGGRVLPLDVAGLIGQAAAAPGGRGVTIERLEVINPVDATADETVAAIDAKLGWALTGRDDR